METLLAKKKMIKANVTRAEKAVDKLTSGDVSATTEHKKIVQLMFDEVDKLIIGFNNDATGNESEAHDENLGEVQDRFTTLLVRLHKIGTENCAIVSPNSDVASEDKLTTRYQNKRELVDRTLKRLFSQPVVQQESVVMLRRLLDSVVECNRLLKVLGQPVEHWDLILVFIVTERLEWESRKEWQLPLSDYELPKFEKLVQFLQHRTRSLAATNVIKSKTSTTVITSRLQGNRSLSALHGTTQDNGCMKCAGSHTLYKCPEFLVIPVQERYAFKLGLKKQWLNVAVSGLTSNNIIQCSSFVQLKLQPTYCSAPVLTVKALVMPKLTGYLPKQSIVSEKSCSHITGLRLADPLYNVPGKVDILFGGVGGSSVAIETDLGWVLSGRISTTSSIPAVTSLHVQSDDVTQVLRKFWELEDIPSASMLTKEEALFNWLACIMTLLNRK
ncbi:hypothetical protein PR048_006533 [Dryococelus australis]|uniref:Peptidase aspartic putative domain-containing protein n=1 Tax=Dryococelus australis TaxID=614101 RepID=A0ABQ9IBW8_9NEOP|nr:hypothetical protein PR048_006533 [Dryococelus australis]